MNETDFDAHLRGLIRLQRTAQADEGMPGAATRIDRLSRAAAMCAEASEAIAAAVSKDFGHRSFDETRFEVFGAVNAFRHAAANVASWMMPENTSIPRTSTQADFPQRGVGLASSRGSCV